MNSLWGNKWRIASWLSFLLALPAPASPIDLSAAYLAALQKTEAMPIQASRIEQSKESVSQALGGIFPSLALSSTYQRTDTPGNPSSSYFSQQTTTKIAVTQPIFHGFKEFSGWNAAKADLRAQQALASQARLSTYALVAQAFLDVLSTSRDLKNLHMLEDLTIKRVKELESRQNIGRSRKGEVLAAQSQLATTRAQIDAANSQLELARYRFSMATGLPKDTALADISEVPGSVKDLQFYLSRLEQRPDIRALREQLDATQETVSIARAGHFPAVDFAGNYYLKRTGLLEGSKWDAALTFSLPIFQGGVVQSQVRQAADKAGEKELLLAQARRQADTDLRSYHRNVVSGLDQIRLLTEALDAAERNYKAQNRDYSFGLVTNLDVLQALNSFVDAKRTYDRTRYQTLVYRAALDAASDLVPADPSNQAQ